MAYTNNVPQGNQTIAQTQPLILGNFGFIQTDLDVEHIFNGNAPFGTQAEGTHIQASMPNQASPPALGTGIAGIYYVSGNLPHFKNSTTDYTLVQNLLKQGSNSVASGAAFQILPAGSYMGTVSAFQNVGPFRYQFIQFWLSGATLIQNAMASGGTGNITLQLDGSNNLQILNSSGSTQTIKWQIIYSTAP